MKKAFTLIELVFVIVIIGILSAVIIPKIETNNLQEAAIQLVSHIRYTQHLAMVDDKFDAKSDSWYRQRWSIAFISNATKTEGKRAYSVFSDDGTYEATASSSKVNNGELAMDPMNSGKYLSGGTQSLATDDSKAIKKMNLGVSYGIETLVLSDGCSGFRFSFDNMGRPISGYLSNYTTSYTLGTTSSPKLMTELCKITLTDGSGESIVIQIEPETGYAYILRT